MRFHTLIFPVLATSAVALLAGTTPRFAPAAGTTLKKTITSENKAATTKVEFLIDGESPEGAPDNVVLTFEGLDTFVISDEYVKCAEGRPVELKRTFEELSVKNVQSGGPDPDAEPQKIEKESELASKVVVFKWNDKKEEYVAAFEDGKGDEELLKNLDADLDFLEFLPKKDAKEGDEWELDGAKARALMNPGGDLKMKSKEGDDEEGSEMQDELRDNVKGKLTLTHKGTKEEGDAKFVVIEFKGELETSGDRESEEGGVTALSVKLTVTGEITWDMVHDHVHSVRMDGKDDTLYSMTADVEFGEEKHKLEQKFTFEGTVKFALELGK
jgi:hypothetical protein